MRSFCLAILLCVSVGVEAATQHFTVVNNSWVTNTGIGGGENFRYTATNTITGRLPYDDNLDPIITDYNSFYDFDVSSIGPGVTIESVSISFAAGDGRFISPDTYEIVELWDVTNPTPVFGGTTAERIAFYNDLMTGTKYGEAQVFRPATPPPDNMPEVVIELDSASFGQIGYQDTFSVGTHLSTISGIDSQVLWASSTGYDAVLTVTTSVVPAPAAVWLFGSALAGLGWMRRKQAA
jgi:hypothetical protein